MRRAGASGAARLLRGAGEQENHVSLERRQAAPYKPPDDFEVNSEVLMDELSRTAQSS